LLGRWTRDKEVMGSTHSHCTSYSNCGQFVHTSVTKWYKCSWGSLLNYSYTGLG